MSADPHNNNGTISYTYDSVGNRKTLNSTLPPSGGVTYTYDADDRLGSDTYDGDGNTINSSGTANTYDFENHMVQHGYVAIVYDGDGNRVSETVGGVATNYLVDTQNPTGYAQVLDELQSGTVTRTYSYGLAGWCPMEYNRIVQTVVETPTYLATAPTSSLARRSVRTSWHSLPLTRSVET